jgi:hypothetical protein
MLSVYFNMTEYYSEFKDNLFCHLQFAWISFSQYIGLYTYKLQRTTLGFISK